MRVYNSPNPTPNFFTEYKLFSNVWNTHDLFPDVIYGRADIFDTFYLLLNISECVFRPNNHHQMDADSVLDTKYAHQYH